MNYNEPALPPNEISSDEVVPTALVPNRSAFSDGLLAGMLALATLALFWPATHYDFINYDDNLYVTENVQVQNGLTWTGVKWAFTNPVADNWHPLTVLSHMLVCQLFGVQPWAHHLVNLLLHAANAGLVFLLFRRLTGSIGRSFVVAALFAFHPLRIQSVVWVSERKDVLSALFGLLVLLAYTRYVAQLKVQNSKFKISYVLALIFFALGLMSKPMLITLPFVLLLLDYWPLERIQNSKLEIKNLKWLVVEKIPFFALTALDGVVTYLVQQQGGSLGAQATLPLETRLGNALVSYCRQLGKIFWPTDLAIFYPYPGAWPLTIVLLSASFLIAATWICFRQRRNPPYLLVGWLWFLGMLVPVIGFIQTGLQAMADRHTYLPSLGLLIVTVWGVNEGSRRWRGRDWVLPILALAAIIAVCVGTRQQLGYWQDSETLFRRAVAVTTGNYVARGNLGEALAAKGKTDEAIQEFREAICLQPNYPDAQNNLGIALGSQGQLDEAIAHFQVAIRWKPVFADAHYDLGVALDRSGKLDAAMDQYQTVIRLQPGNASAWNNLGIDFARQGRVDEATGCFREAVRLKPDYADARSNLVRALEIKSAPASQ